MVRGTESWKRGEIDNMREKRERRGDIYMKKCKLCVNMQLIETQKVLRKAESVVK